MNCIICESDSDYYFSKTYTESPFAEFMRPIGTVDYHKCRHCGFVLSGTHSALDQKIWDELNKHFHHYIENPDNETKGNQPPYAEQAIMLSFLGKNDVISLDSVVDYAAGYGTLSNILWKYYGLKVPIFDRYVQGDNSGRYIDRADLRRYKTVINSAMFEHVLRREDLDAVNGMVDQDGSLIIHTVVCEKIPDDPNWFYLRPPVHTAFHTNRSMEILMEQWGYRSSIYCPPAKCWVLLREKGADVNRKIASINRELQSTWFHCKDGFVDYWKGF
ncbi:class I SAM-dependent methyltransferase [Paraburkholderia elongata]|uniref:Methyltransferase domain-containing protein n=1 Tax=Paraburkholderia elongata TaxID=2675747 RepID=A0A972NMQ0_9BURK|nr:methyltransferase domain-containing protein [Paraburkholderia elongata]NPT55717.1 methyltransferase domain-containing protein [Paraburkholderia elongata]